MIGRKELVSTLSDVQVEECPYCGGMILFNEKTNFLYHELPFCKVFLRFTREKMPAQLSVGIASSDGEFTQTSVIDLKPKAKC